MTEAVATRSDRVNIDEAVIGIYHQLTEGSSIEQAPFKMLKDVFMLAVAVGYRRGTRQPAPSTTRHTIRKEVFSDNDYQLLKAIAIATTGDVEVLLSQANVLTIAEEYAQVGIHEVKAELLDQPGGALWNLVEIVSG
jgi:dnd system-associated protein 4